MIESMDKLQKEYLRASSLTGLLKSMGYGTGGDSLKKIKRELDERGFDYSHLLLKRGQFHKTFGRPKVAEKIIEAWKAGEHPGYVGKSFAICRAVKRYLIGQRGEKCEKCGWDQKHPVTNRVPIEVNHIDGNPANCLEPNLELICPNCHSLTVNYRALNKKSCRNRNKCRLDSTSKVLVL